MNPSAHTEWGVRWSTGVIGGGYTEQGARRTAAAFTPGRGTDSHVVAVLSRPVGEWETVSEGEQG